MLPTLETKTVDILMDAIDAGNAAEIRRAAKALIHAAFDHLFYHVAKPTHDDGMAMGTLLVAASDLESR